MITTIIFDIGNVLAKFRWEDCLTDLKFNDITKEVVANATVLNPIWNEFDRGVLSDEEVIDFCIHCAPDYQKEIEMFFDSIDQLVTEFDYAVPLIRSLKSSAYKVYILSNYGKTAFSYAKRDFKFLDYVDGGVISYQVKKTKPEPEIYETLINNYKINPSNAVFLDDRLENIEAAKQFGIHTIHFSTLEKALLELKALGVKLDNFNFNIE